MTDRERWIVYPLLFLALGAALRDKLAKQTRAKQIVCEQLYLVDSEGRPAAVLTGEELRFDLAGAGNGFIKANTIDAQGLFQLGRPVMTATPGQGLSVQQLLQMLPQLRLSPGLPQPQLTPPTPLQELRPDDEATGEPAPTEPAPPEPAPPAEPEPEA
ncbi:hypothetical protein Pla108_36330 [Botrimarina colliarenosi]|uniref:Uncharacterized protein n=1 Tax=Botrimarina colliarenosi TaxID=2528001 RepID=A0A5C6A4G7_9BACT|nr:hypothetical protein [Botrimarina colliarenosi]TWT94784.1 hypothetical protein Pla108_36330 [Botrimarina colliarenosi]